jgi:hypothetical protein
VPHRAFKSIDRFPIAFSRHFDAAVGQIAHPAFDAFAARRRFGEEAETDALNTTADEISSRDPHITLRNGERGLRSGM